MDLRVFTQRSSAVAIATGVLVSVTLAQFGAPWGLLGAAVRAGGPGRPSSPTCQLGAAVAAREPEDPGRPRVPEALAAALAAERGREAL